jgi:selenocysteine lyase/cysteine desulfurase
MEISGNIERRTAELSQYLIDGLQEQSAKVNTPDKQGERGTLVTYNTGSFEKTQEVYEALKKEGIIVAHRYGRWWAASASRATSSTPTRRLTGF